MGEVMADEKKPAFVSLNGVDISRFVTDAHVLTTRDLFDALQNAIGARREPITISGVWDDGRETCIACQQRFTPGPEGTFAGKWEGEFQDWRMHSECYEAADTDDLNEGFTPYEHARGSSVDG